MSAWLHIRNEDIYQRLAWRSAPSERWPLAGQSLASLKDELALDAHDKFYDFRVEELCKYIGALEVPKNAQERICTAINTCLSIPQKEQLTPKHLLPKEIGNSTRALSQRLKGTTPESRINFVDFIQQLKNELGNDSSFFHFTIPQVQRITIEATNQDYLIANGYLVPHYPVERKNDDVGNKTELDLIRRNEGLIISRARGFISNAQPELGINQTRAQIGEQLAKLRYMPEDNVDQCRLKMSRFRIIAGEILSRLETLGRVITQGNTEGTVLEYDSLKNKAAIPEILRPVLAEALAVSNQTAGRLRIEMERHLQQQDTGLSKEEIRALVKKFQPSARLEKTLKTGAYDRLMSHTIPPKALEQLSTEYKGYCDLLASEGMTSLLHGILLTDKQPDRDGILIDYFREISKPILYPLETANESYIRGNIVEKIGYAMESIDSIHDALRDLLTQKETRALFEKSLTRFLAEQPKESHIKTTDDVIRELGRYALLCKARTCTQGKDTSYGDVFTQKDALSDFFEGPNGLLQSMQDVGRDTQTPCIQALQDVLRRGLQLMERTGYTRTACDKHAPEPWIPNLSPDAPAMEKYLAQQFLTESGRARANTIFMEASYKPERERENYLRLSFSSLGLLRADIAQLTHEIEQSSIPQYAQGEKRQWSTSLAKSTAGKPTSITFRGSF